MSAQHHGDAGRWNSNESVAASEPNSSESNGVGRVPAGAGTAAAEAAAGSAAAALEVKSEESEIHHYAQAGDVEEVRRCLLAGFNKVDEVDELGCTPVHLAGAMGHTSVVRLLVQEHGAAVDARDGALCTALHAASEGGHPDLVELLLHLGAEIDARNGKEQTPLHYACGYGQVEAAQQLVIRGASTGARDRQGNTPLHLACSGGGADVVRLLVANGSPLNALNLRRRRPLHLACRSGHSQIAIALLENGADPSARDANGLQAVDMIGAKRRVSQAVRFDLINTLERYQLGEYALARPAMSSTSSLRQMWRERDDAARAGGPVSLEGSGTGSFSRVGSPMDSYSAGSLAGLGGREVGVGLGVPGAETNGGGGAASERGIVHSNRNARWTVGAAVASRLEEMRARELVASLRAKVQENEAMKRYLDSVKEEMRMLQEKVSEQSATAHPSPSHSGQSAGGSIAERVARSMYGNEGIGGRQSHFAMDDPGASRQAVRDEVDEVSAAEYRAGRAAGARGTNDAVEAPPAAYDTLVEGMESVSISASREAAPSHGGVTKVSNESGARAQVIPVANALGPPSIEATTSGGGSSAEQPGGVGTSPVSMSQLLMAKRTQLQSLLDTQQGRS